MIVLKMMYVKAAMMLKLIVSNVIKIIVLNVLETYFLLTVNVLINKNKQETLVQIAKLRSFMIKTPVNV